MFIYTCTNKLGYLAAEWEWHRSAAPAPDGCRAAGAIGRRQEGRWHAGWVRELTL